MILLLSVALEFRWKRVRKTRTSRGDGTAWGGPPQEFLILYKTAGGGAASP